MKNCKFLQALLVSCIVLVTLSGCSKTESEKQDATSAAVSAVVTEIPVQGYRTTAQSISTYLNFTGDVMTPGSVDIVSEMTGKVKQIAVEVGDVVGQGDVLMTIDPSRPGTNYQASDVTAIKGGTVTAFYPVVGMNVAAGMTLGTISETDNLEIAFNVVERYVSQVHVGQTASVRFSAFPGETFAATVTKVSPTLDASSRTRRVVCKLDAPDPRILIGMFAKVQVHVQDIHDSVVIPYSAVITRDGTSYVYVVDESVRPNVARRKDVALGVRTNDLIQIVHGLTVGEVVVTKGQNLLGEGSAVSVSSFLEELR